MREDVFVPDLTRSGVRVKGLGLVWTSGLTRSDWDQHQTRSRTRHWNPTRLVSYVLLTSLRVIIRRWKSMLKLPAWWSTSVMKPTMATNLSWCLVLSLTKMFNYDSFISSTVSGQSRILYLWLIHIEHCFWAVTHSVFIVKMILLIKKKAEGRRKLSMKETSVDKKSKRKRKF